MLARLLAVGFYTVLGVAVLGFMFSNRQDVSIDIPFLADIQSPLYVALAISFALGLLLGLSYAALLSFSALRRERRQRRAIESLEHEVEARSQPLPKTGA